MPTLVVPEDSTMRKRFDHYLGYGRHHLQFDEDFWQRRQEDKSSLSEKQRKKQKSTLVAPGSGEVLGEKIGGSSV